jgi:hypothetical protein
MEGKMSSQECSQQEIEDIIVAIAERHNSCVCFTFWNVPVIPMNPNQTFPLKPHPRCPMHKDLRLEE